MQKTFVVDFLTKQQKVNEGEFPQYYVKNSHPAIIDPTLFEVVQGEIARRLASGGQSASNPFSGKVICSDCGGYFGPKIWHSATKYRRAVFRCNQKYNGKSTCATTHLTEQALQEIFIRAANELLSDKDEILRDLRDMLLMLADTGSLEKEMASAAQERDVVHGLIQRCIDENAHVALDQEAYEKRYAELSSLLIERQEPAGNVCWQVRFSFLTPIVARCTRKKRNAPFMHA